MRTAIVIVAAVAALATACGDDGASVSAGPGTPSRPSGGDEVVVQVLVDGGFVPVEAAITAVPVTTVLGDGTVITTAPVTAIYPGPAITPLQQVRIDAAAVDRLLTRAEELGLLEGPLEFGRPPVADAPNTTVTIVAGGTTHRHVAYALGITDDRAASGGVAGLSPEAVANRRALSQFVAATGELPPGREMWVPTEIAVYDLGAYQPEPQLAQRPVDWPLSRPPATSTTPGTRPCALVQGDERSQLADALTRANARTPWVVAGSQRSLAFRPVIPGQPGCAPS